MAGDLLNRQTANASIANNLVNTVGPLVLDTIMMVFYLVIMLRYNVFMTMIGLGSMLLNIFAARFVSNKRVNLTRLQMRDSANLDSTTLAGISMTETDGAGRSDRRGRNI